MHEDKFLVNFLNTPLVLSISLRKKYTPSLALVAKSQQVDN
ncbi:MAG: hypothetical protein ACL9RN_10135 [Cylindrospermopsis raciborskii]|nr:hypothetical protein [Cylindrospermopsis raciborskii]